MKRLLVIAIVATAGCTTVPPTNVHQPMTARPAPRYEGGQANGSIYQAATTRPLFEDRHARYVGDTITVTITENTSASSQTNSQLSKTNADQAAVTALAGLPGQSLLGLNYNASSSNAFNGKGQAANTNVFTGSMTVTVIDVMPNGNLLVSGEKQLGIGQELEYVRVSGVVDPRFVDSTNTIPSSKIADARIEYKNAGQNGEGMSMGWLARFFLNVLPF